MATITTDTFLDDGTARTAGETWNMNGGKLTVRTDTRWHANAPVSMTGSLGSLVVSATLGGGVLFDARNVRWMPYNTGSGNVPVIGTTVTKSGVSGYLLGVYDTLTSAPTAVGAAMPVDGFIKFREVTSGPFTAGALTGIGASATGPDVTGWIEVVADQATVMTASRIGEGFQSRGDWFYLDNTNGTLGQILQVPTNGGGVDTWAPGVWIEDAPGTDAYSFWPALDGVTNGWTQLNLGAPLGATDIRQRFVKALTNGQMQIGEAFTQASTYAVATQASTYTWASDFVTVTFTAHGYSAGEQVYLDFTSGAGTPDGIYTIVDVPATNTYRVALTGSGAGGNVTACGRVTVTFTAHGQTQSKTVYLDVTSGGLTDGVYEIRGTTAANTYTVAAPVSPATAAGNATMTLTIGHIPASGCKTRIPNVIMRQCATGTRASNAKPPATLGTRPDYNTSGACVIDYEYAYSDWYMYFSQAYTAIMRHCATFSQVRIDENATPFVLEDVGVGCIQALASQHLYLGSNLVGGTVTGFNGQLGTAPASNQHSVHVIQCNDVTITDSIFGCIGFNRSSGYLQISSCRNVVFEDCTIVNQAIVLTSSFDIDVLNQSYCDRYFGFTNSVSATNAIVLQVKVTDVLFDGFIFGIKGIPFSRVHPYGGLFALSSNERIRIRNIGTLTAPVSETNLGVNVTNLVISPAGANIDIKVQNVHYGMVRSDFQAIQNVDKNVTFEKCSLGKTSTGNNPVFALSALSSKSKGIRQLGVPSVVANASVYGTHFMDIFQSDTQGYLKFTTNEPNDDSSALFTLSGTPQFTSSPSVVLSDSSDEVIAEMDYFAQGHTGFKGVSDRLLLPVVTGMPGVSGAFTYTWVANVVTVTLAAHGYKTGDQLWLDFSSGGLGVLQSGVYTITVVNTTTFTVSLTGSGTAGDGRSLVTNIYEYQIDLNDGSGYSGWKNFVYQHLRARFVNGSAVVQMNDTSNVDVGDYVWSNTITDFPSGTSVASVDSATQITLSNNAATNVGSTGLVWFTKLPSETINPTNGFKLKLRIKPITANSLNAFTYLYAFTTSTLVAQQAISYPLDLTSLTLTGLKNPTEIRVFDAGTTTEIAGQENVTSGSFTTSLDAGSYPFVDISILSLGYQNTRLTNIDLSGGNVNIPVQQQLDRQYGNV